LHPPCRAALMWERAIYRSNGARHSRPGRRSGSPPARWAENLRSTGDSQKLPVTKLYRLSLTNNLTARNELLNGSKRITSDLNLPQTFMNWLSISNYLNLFAFCVGIAAGVVNGDPPGQLLDWRLIAILAAIGIPTFPFMILAVLRLHVLIKSRIQLIPPRRDRCFISLSRPLDSLLFAAHLSFWQGLGLLTTFWMCWPHNFILGIAMVLGYYSIIAGIRLTLAMIASKPVQSEP